VSTNATRFTVFELDAQGGGKVGGSYTSIIRAEGAALARARQLAERIGSTVTEILITDGDGETVARVPITRMVAA
jgi:hypothetical protein